MIHVLAMRALYVLLLEGRPMTLSEWALALSERQMLAPGGLNIHVLRHASTQGWVTWTPGEPYGTYAATAAVVLADLEADLREIAAWEWPAALQPKPKRRGAR